MSNLKSATNGDYSTDCHVNYAHYPVSLKIIYLVVNSILFYSTKLQRRPNYV